ncbi:IclR family transcriptional regulator C-terminal domain-containing protein [Streptomyces cacaoi]|uniref:IclR family transcriptional regulator domain-containing protein n=1 Tax=Streptomyces cacaoi TaxID=1898 RepID=UPI00374990D9
MAPGVSEAASVTPQTVLQAPTDRAPADTAAEIGEARAAGPEAVGPLERGLAMLRIMAAASGPMRPGDLARVTGLARSAADRVVATLVHLGHLRAEERELMLAPRLMELGNAYLDASGYSRALRPSLERLTRTLEESVSAIVLDGCDARIVGKAVPAGRMIPLGSRVGDLLPAERCAAGAVLATAWNSETYATWRGRHTADPFDAGFPDVPPRRTAPLPERREADFTAWTAETAANGWALDDQLVAPGLVALSVPVFFPDGRPVCAISMLAHTSRRSADQLRDHALPAMTDAAQDIADALYDTSRIPVAASLPASPAYTDAKSELGPFFLQALARGLAVLTALGRQPGGLTLAEAAEATGLSYPSTRRNLLTLRRLSYVEQHGRRFLPAPRVLELGYARLSTLTLADIARPHLADLVGQVRESASLAVLDGAEVRYVARVATEQITSARITPGTRLPAYATSMGRVLLAGLPEAERQKRLRTVRPQALTPYTLTSHAALASALERAAREGFALVEQELETGLRSLAVPVRDSSGRAMAALNIALHAGPEPPEHTRDTMLPALHACAARVEADLAVAFPHAPVITD